MLFEGEATYGVVAARLKAFLLQHVTRLSEIAPRDELLLDAHEKTGGM